MMVELEKGNSRDVLAFLARQADSAALKMVQSGYRSPRAEHREFRAKTLAAYRVFRGTHPDLYAIPRNPRIPALEMDEWAHNEQALQELLSRGE